MHRLSGSSAPCKEHKEASKEPMAAATEQEREEWEKTRLGGEVGTGCTGYSADHDTKEKNPHTQVWVGQERTDLGALMNAQFAVYMHRGDFTAGFRAGVGVGEGLIKFVPSFSPRAQKG